MWIRHLLSPKTLLAETWKYLLLVLGIAAAATTVYLEVLTPHLRTPTLVVSTLGIAVSFFLGFLNSHAYERWMEARGGFGRVQLGCRDFARMVLAFIRAPGDAEADADARALRNRLVRRQIAVIQATRSRLQDDRDAGYRKYLDDEDVAGLGGMSHVPIALLLQQTRGVYDAVGSNHLDLRLVTTVNHALNDTTAAIATCDRINHTPFFPFYLTIVRYAAWAFLTLFPLAIADAVGYWAILYTFLIGAIFIWLIESASGLMRPFETRRSAVPIESITRQTEIDLLQQLGEETIPSPVAPIDGVYLP